MKKITALAIITLIIIPCILTGAPRSPRWASVREAHLRSHPVCALCGSSIRLNVHHIQPFHLYPEKELDPTNLVTLCESENWGFQCHLIVGHGGNFRYENKNVLEDIFVLKEIASPNYIRQHGTEDRITYIAKLKARVKEQSFIGPKQQPQSVF